MAADYLLYGGDHSLYTGKARAYMRFKGLNWEEVTATRAIYKTTLLPNVGAAIVPVLATAEGRFIQDTTDIIDFLEAAHPAVPVYPDTPVQKLVALMLELYGDEWLVIPAMHYRWSMLEQQREFIFSEFGKMSAPEASREEQLVIGEKTSTMFRGSITMLGITEQTIPAIEQVYLELLDQLDVHFGQYDYLLGSRPSIGDFGLMGPLYAHLGRDQLPDVGERVIHSYAQWMLQRPCAHTRATRVGGGPTMSERFRRKPVACAYISAGGYGTA